jgi:endonuclease I
MLLRLQEISRMMRLFIILCVCICRVASAQETIDFECGGTSVYETAVVANQTVRIGDVPPGLHRLAIHLWSDEDMDIQVLSGDTTVIHWKSGIVYHSDEQTSSFRGDTFVYSGFNGDGFGPGNEYVIFEGFTANEYTFLAHANQGGRIMARYGWLPIETCNITEKYYRNLNDLMNSHANDGERRLQTKAQLHDQIDGHTKLSYDNCWTALRTADQNPANSGQVIGIYSRKGIWKSYQDGSSTCGGFPDDCWNREHVYPKSRGDFGTSSGAGTDLHALRAEDRSVNTARSNKNFLAGGSAVTDCTSCKTTSTAFEPPNASKGAVARMMFYMATRYNGDADSNSINLLLLNGSPGDPAGSTGNLGDLATLKSWNNLYPPSSEEINRNNIIQNYYQGNRNPFIDTPSLANSLF